MTHHVKPILNGHSYISRYDIIGKQLLTEHLNTPDHGFASVIPEVKICVAIVRNISIDNNRNIPSLKIKP